MALGLNSIVEVGYQGTLAGQVTISLFHYRVSAVSGIASPIAEQNMIMNLVGVNNPGTLLRDYADCLPGNWNLGSVRVQAVSPVRVRASITSPAVVGARPGLSPSPNIAACITKSTALGGRKQVGTLHLPGIIDADMVSGQINAGLIGLMNLLGVRMREVLVEPAGTGRYTPVIWHRNVTPQPSADDIINTVSRNTVRVMRRRTVGVGI